MEFACSAPLMIKPVAYDRIQLRSKFYYQWLLAYEFKDMRSIDLSDGEAAARLAEALLVCPKQSPAPSSASHVLSPRHSALPPALSYGRTSFQFATPGWNPAAADTGGYGGGAACGGRAYEPPSPRPPSQKTPGHGGANPHAVAPPSPAAMGVPSGSARPLVGQRGGAAAASAACAPDAAAAAKEEERMGDSHGDSPRGGGGSDGAGGAGGGAGAGRYRAGGAAGDGGGNAGGGRAGGGGGGGGGERNSRWRELPREDAQHAAALVEAAACHRSVAAPAPAAAAPGALGCVRRKGAVRIGLERGVPGSG
jgi:hypothetical protein